MLDRRSSSVVRGPVYGRAYGRIGSLAIAFSGLIAGRAHAAEPETAALVYERPAELEQCPDEPAFRRAVSARLGRDPFVDGSARTIHVRLSQSGSVLSAVVSVEQAGSARGDRRIDTRGGCDELASGAALAVSIAIDPLAALGPAAPSEPETKPAEPAAKPESSPPQKPVAAKPNERPRPSPRRAPAERVAAGMFARVGGRAWLAAVPSLSAGPTLGLGYRHGVASIAVDALGVLSRSEEVPNSARSVSVGVLGAELSPCANFADFRACALFGAGALLARGAGVSDPRTGEKWTAWAGASAGYTFATGRFSITPTVELAARLTKTELNLNSETVWTTPRVFGSLGLELGYDFWR